jgi:hypothetical protein
MNPNILLLANRSKGFTARAAFLLRSLAIPSSIAFLPAKLSKGSLTCSLDVARTALYI